MHNTYTIHPFADIYKLAPRFVSRSYINIHQKSKPKQTGDSVPSHIRHLAYIINCIKRQAEEATTRRRRRDHLKRARYYSSKLLAYWAVQESRGKLRTCALG
jgi:hypothetical protein